MCGAQLYGRPTSCREGRGPGMPGPYRALTWNIHFRFSCSSSPSRGVT